MPHFNSFEDLLSLIVISILAKDLFLLLVELL